MQMMKKTAVGLAAILTSQMAVGQSFPPPPPPPDMESFNTPPPAFDAAPPPPPAGDFSAPAGGASSGGSNSGGASGGKSATLSKKQQSKFAKAGLEDITNENFPETIESFDFPNVEITDVINAISSLTGKNFIIDPGVRGKITIVAPSKITVAEAYKAFLSALAITGFTVVPSGSFLKIKSARNAQRDSIETYSGEYYPNSDQMITRIIHLKHISADQVNRELRILSSKDGEMSVYSPTNSLILSDYGSNIDRVMKIINQLDVPGFDEQLEVIRIRYAKAKDLADLVDKIVNKGDKGAANRNVPGAFSAGVPRFTRSTSSSGQQGASFMAIPDDRTNSIIVVGNKAGILRMRTLIGRLDTKISLEEGGGVFVYYVKNGEAKKIAETLKGVTKDAAPKQQPGGFGGGMLGGIGGNPLASASAGIFGGDVQIQADETTNALVITASKPDYDRVKRILDQIDVARDQVFVESIIMEMTDKDASNWGIGYYQFDKSGAKSGFGSQATPLSGLFGINSPAGATLGLGRGEVVTITDPATKVATEIKSLLGFITFIKQTTKANILSTPQITAMDSQEATIEVGDQVAVKVDKSVSANGSETSSVTFGDATIKLVIKPFISPKANTVRMDIQQTVKQVTTVAQAKALEENSQPLATRFIKTMLVVRDQDTAVLGGLMKDNVTEKVTKVPLLGDLPIIGWLFKGRETNKEKTNLLVFLTPKIMRNPGDQKMVLNKKLDERLKYIKEQGGKDMYGNTIEKIRRTSQVDDNNAE
jgi:general secretion pathway protein D